MHFKTTQTNCLQFEGSGDKQKTDHYWWEVKSPINTNASQKGLKVALKKQAKFLKFLGLVAKGKSFKNFWLWKTSLKEQPTSREEQNVAHIKTTHTKVIELKEEPKHWCHITEATVSTNKLKEAFLNVARVTYKRKKQ